MKTLLLIMFFCTFLQMHSTPPSWLATDKQYHFIAGYTIGAATSYVSHRFKLNKISTCAIGIAAGTAVGLGKEYLWDRNFNGTVSLQDSIVTSIGSVAGSISIIIVF